MILLVTYIGHAVLNDSVQTTQLLMGLDAPKTQLVTLASLGYYMAAISRTIQSEAIAESACVRSFATFTGKK